MPIRANWFRQPDDLHTLKSRDQLLTIWYHSVGLGAGLLLNVPPGRRGRIDDADRTRLLDLTDEIASRFATPIPCELTNTGTGALARFAEPVPIDHLELRENLAGGQHIAHHELVVDGRVIAEGRTVGIRRFHAFEPVTVREIQIRLTGGNQALAAANGCHCGHSATAAPPTRGQATPASAKPDCPRRPSRLLST